MAADRPVLSGREEQGRAWHPTTSAPLMLLLTLDTLKWDLNITPSTVSWRRAAQAAPAGPGGLPPAEVEEGGIDIIRFMKGKPIACSICSFAKKK